MRLLIFALSVLVHILVITGVKLNSPLMQQTKSTRVTPITLILLKKPLAIIATPEINQYPSKITQKHQAVPPNSRASLISETPVVPLR
jgi:hypothetical protein